VEQPATFAALGLAEPLISTLSSLGYEEPTPIQAQAIPPLLAGKDLLGRAATGTGKTAAFALPLLGRITRDRTTRALILVPTRELAVQVSEAVRRYAAGLPLSVQAIYGGAAMGPQMRALRDGATVVVATPGRALDHLRRGTLSLAGVEVVVLDEADEMLSMGFAEDLEAILSAAPAARQTALFSATLPDRIVAIADRSLVDPVRVTILPKAPVAGELPRVQQRAYVVGRQWKALALVRILDVEAPASTIVFCRTRTDVDELTQALLGRGHKAEALHGGFSQEQRERVLGRFRAGQSTLLVATDVAARGLDIDHVSHVVNHDVPLEAESYVHRIGRTGRAGREGVALTLVDPREERLLGQIESTVRMRLERAEVPTVAELESHRLSQTQEAVLAAMSGDGLERFRQMALALRLPRCVSCTLRASEQRTRSRSLAPHCAAIAARSAGGRPEARTRAAATALAPRVRPVPPRQEPLASRGVARGNVRRSRRGRAHHRQEGREGSSPTAAGRPFG
jgi:ATP-dependent RNA helicase DeaD